MVQKATPLKTTRGRRRGCQQGHSHCRVLGVPLYLVHTSCIDALEAVTRARLEGRRVFTGFGPTFGH